ncbi:MAG: ABC transporter permease [Acidobacteriota bacterium]
MMKALKALVGKDLSLFFSDRRAVVLSFAAPIVIAAFFGFLFLGSSSDRGKIDLRVADLDHSAVSRSITEALAKDSNLDVKPAATAAQARELVRKGKATAAVVFPEHFGRDAVDAFFRQQNKPALTLLEDPSHSAEAGMIEGILTEHVMQVVSKEAFTGAAGMQSVRRSLGEVENNKTMAPSDKKDLTSILQGVLNLNERNAETGSSTPTIRGGIGVPYVTKTEAVTAHKGVAYNSYSHSFGGMALQFILMAAIEFGMAILLERRTGIWKRLMAAPLRRSTLLMARGVSGAVISLCIFLVCMGFGMVVFGIRIQGSWAGFLLLAVAYSLMASAFGLFLAALGRTPEATRGLAVFAVLILVMLGGAWVPAFIFPAWLQKATLLLPTRWAMDALDAVTWRGLGLASALPAVAIVLAFTVLFALIAIWKFPAEES